MILLGQFDDNVETHSLMVTALASVADRASMLSDLLLQIRLVRVDASGTCLPICLLACLGEWRLRA